jgi:hypothetical protein
MISVFDFINSFWFRLIYNVLLMNWNVSTFRAVIRSHPAGKRRVSRDRPLGRARPNCLVCNKGGLIHFPASVFTNIGQLMRLAAGLDHHRVGSDLNAAEVNPALASDNICLLAGGEGAIVNNGQPMVRRAGNAF